MKVTIRNTNRLFPAILFYSLISFGICSPKTHAQNIQISVDSTAQVIRGFGASNVLLWRPDMTDSEIQTAFGTGRGHLGFTILRIMIEPDQSRWSLYVPTARKAYQMGAKIIASPWYAPSEMVDSVNGESRVRPDMYGAYAAHLDSFYVYMKNNGVPIYGISVQNEPDINNWTSWTPDEILTFMRDYADSIKGPKVMAPESFHFDWNYSDPILKDSAADANTDIICGHIYGGGIAKYPLALEKGKEVWMTEYLSGEYDSGNNLTWALSAGKSINDVMKADMSAYVWWNIVRYYGPIADGEKAAQNPNENYSSAGEITKKGYVMSQFSRFVRPGYVRVYSNGPYGRGYSKVSVTAYTDSSDKVVIVALNQDTSPKDVNFVLGDSASGTFHPYVTSATQDVEPGNDIKASGSGFTATLPAQSITTFVSDSLKVVNTATEKPPARLPGSYKLFQNYPNPFNPTTMIRYRIPSAGHVTLKVFDVLGREVATLVNRRVSAGEHLVRFDSSHLASGMYIYRLKAGNFIQVRKMTLIK